MELKLGKGPAEQAEQGTNRQSMLLVLLLVLVACFGYLYFFTDMIKPGVTPHPAELPSSPPPMLKKPLPPREVQKAATGLPAVTDAKSAATAPPATPAKPSPAKAAAVPGAPPATPDAGKTAPARQATAAVAAKGAPPAPGAVGRKPALSSGGATTAASPPRSTPVAPERTPVPAAAKKPAVAAGKADAAAVSALSRKKRGTALRNGPVTVVVGTYQMEEALAADMAKVGKAGLEASVQPGPRTVARMNRLLLGEYADRAKARAELDRLKQHTADGFIMEQRGNYAVYAGSYLQESSAVAEKRRLAAAGINVILKRAEVPIPTKRLTAGRFPDRKGAENALRKLKGVGLTATLLEQQ